MKKLFLLVALIFIANSAFSAENIDPNPPIDAQFYDISATSDTQDFFAGIFMAAIIGFGSFATAIIFLFIVYKLLIA